MKIDNTKVILVSQKKDKERLETVGLRTPDETQSYTYKTTRPTISFEERGERLKEDRLKELC